jgi:rhodanese-related sulfurtransferase
MERPGRFSVSAQELRAQIGTAAAPTIVDVRTLDEFETDGALIVGSIRRAPGDVSQWQSQLPPGRCVVLYCQSGGDTSRELSAQLAKIGIDARALAGGMAEWRELALPTRRKCGPSPSRWVTRERPRVDRIACPWLVRRFIDPEAEFLYVPGATVRDVAARLGATPYDIADAEFGHVGDQCSFDAFIRIFGIADAALDRLALIVRGADTGAPNLTPESAGLVAISGGLSVTIVDDHAMLAHGMVIYDALYAWCRSNG